MESKNGKTLLDYNGPAITGDSDIRNDQAFANHVRVKRSESNDSFSPSHSWGGNGTIYASDELLSRFEGSHVNSNHKIESDMVDATTRTYSWHKRGILSKNERRRERVKGSTRRSKYQVEAQVRGKNRGTSKPSRKFPTRKVGSGMCIFLSHEFAVLKEKTWLFFTYFSADFFRFSSSLGRNINQAGFNRTVNFSKRNFSILETWHKNKDTAINAHTRKIDGSQTKSKKGKRESENSNGWNSDVGPADSERTRADESETPISQSDSVSLINDSRPEGQREENSVVLPFVHTGKAELRVRIEKIPRNESSFINPDCWMNHSTTIGPSSTTPIQSKYETIVNTGVTNSIFAPNFNYTGTKREEADSSIEFASSGIKTDRNLEDGKYRRTNEKLVKFADEDMNYHAKRNQGITSKRRLRSDKNATGLKRSKDTGQITGGIKHERTTGENGRRARGNRAVRSIEEIKDLIEKLVVKVTRTNVFIQYDFIGRTLFQVRPIERTSRTSRPVKDLEFVSRITEFCEKYLSAFYTLLCAIRFKVNELQIYVSNQSETPRTTDPCGGKKAARVARLSRNSNYKSEFIRDTGDRLTNNREERAFRVAAGASRVKRANSRSRRKLLRKWDRWTDWSSCSVTCGKGRQIRWRHCLRDCDDAEIEMAEKACQLPACPPGKFLGIF
ncbi:PREDICTED: uncharacterized protein LOC106745448 [Dinoponera quadriceps]|uniref:Uncharacterized protein LOC106745448 n=1 Tax=Dinoponera quadriceps TaxID=609295 RepID=A0A6P3XF93_DINQU|nr:PREDICTED: uncharacterized protein LOC106745448 [Dinoponera quadriceps]